MLFLIVASLIALFMIFPYLRIFFKRIVLYFKLCTLCRRCHLHLHGGYPFWMFARKKDVRFDFYLEGDDTVFAVKLFAVRRKIDILYFINDDSYRMRSHLALFSKIGAHCVLPIDSAVCSLPQYALNIKNDAGYPKTVRRVLLVHPTCGEIRQCRNGQEQIIGAGDPVGDMTLCSFSKLDALVTT